MHRALLLLAGLTIAIAAHSEPLPWQPPLSIRQVMPTIGPPSGGSLVRITGHGFDPPVRVFFALGDLSVESFVTTVTETQIDIITPPVLLGPDEQMRVATITVESRGYRVTAQDAYIYENPIQHPKILTASPNSGPKDGGTRVTIFGEGFQQPVQVLFGDAEARVINVMRDQIVVESPSASEPGHVGITVRNISSQTEATLEDAFRYLPPLHLLSVVPDRGRAGTRIAVTAEAMPDLVAVNVAGIPATVVQLTRTRLTAILGTPPTSCGLTGPVEVIDIVNGATVTGLQFTYEPESLPTIAAVTPRAIGAGKIVTMQIDNADLVRIDIGGKPAPIVARTGSTFRVRVPADLPFATGACTLRGIEGRGPIPSRFDLTVTDLRTGCASTRAQSLDVTPAVPITCTLPPRVTILSRACSSRSVVIANERGRADLVITAPESVSPRAVTIPGGTQAELTLTPGASLERLRFETNDPRQPWVLVCVSP